MNMLRLRKFVLLAALTLLSVSGAQRASAETLLSSNVDSRVLVAMQFDEGAVQETLPDGWTLMAFPGGAVAGANALLIFADRYLAKDAEGNPTEPSTYRAIAFASLGKSTTSDEVRTFVTKVFSPHESVDPYGNASPATITRRAGVDSADNAQPRFSEAWSLMANGGELSMSLAYASGPLTWSARESQSYSNVDPAIHHLNRFEQLSDLAMSAPLGKSLDGDMEIRSSIPELASLFDGQEKTIAVIMIPMYRREVFKP
ncbi:hypothetical protein PGB28_01595 [Primorskyibacter aestuariivivens]|uniref:hypothetical protein n=1 Tax=Primorskyibacter aestuariivivens TaxID=1888912 RepID=UPI0023008833|nr:hypothetical protein [Primorskyibacter aestuariivivens]MDA7427135.1 hypothetical protein [Primorskyibacter aestuariivivens]